MESRVYTYELDPTGVLVLYECCAKKKRNVKKYKKNIGKKLKKAQLFSSFFQWQPMTPTNTLTQSSFFICSQ